MDQAFKNWVTVAEKSAVGPQTVIGVTVGELDIAIYHVDGEFYATDNICPHADAYLNYGCLRGDVIECPVHGARFEIKTGKGRGGAPFGDIKKFDVRVVGNDIQVDIADAV
jgi:3-phenylpropionate/trans-cinnamate dioxygenase ferredoxin component